MISSKATITELRNRMIAARSDHAGLEGIKPEAIAQLLDLGVIRIDDDGAYFTEEGMKEAMEKKYSGYGYHGGGRPKKEEGARRCTVSISGTRDELDRLKAQAAEAGLTVSRYVLNKLLIRK